MKKEYIQEMFKIYYDFICFAIFIRILTLIWVGFLEVRFEVVRGRGKITPLPETC